MNWCRLTLWRLIQRLLTVEIDEMWLLIDRFDFGMQIINLLWLRRDFLDKPELAKNMSHSSELETCGRLMIG